jgi:hypothetical protein
MRRWHSEYALDAIGIARGDLNMRLRVSSPNFSLASLVVIFELFAMSAIFSRSPRLREPLARFFTATTVDRTVRRGV